MATVSTIRAADNPCKARYKALVARGKPKKLAIVAVMRTMIVTLDAMVRDNMPRNPMHSAGQNHGGRGWFDGWVDIGYKA